MPENCQELISSEENTEFIVTALTMTPELLDSFQGICYQQIDLRYFTVYTPIERLKNIDLNEFYYGIFPKLFSEMSTAALEISGITRLANQPVLQLKGQGVLIGIVDSGIDFTHPAFIDAYGKTRILRLWDQSDSTGPAPAGIGYGTEYTREEIDRALASEHPGEIVRERDETGHGTFMAGVAAGSEDIVNDFTGAAPEAGLIIVKLKPAKEFLRNFYFINPGIPAYQENDIMMGINYLRRCALELNMPLSIPFGLGSNLGGHDGLSALSHVVSTISRLPGYCVTVPAGNEGNGRQHFYGTVLRASEPAEMEISVSENVPGIFFEIWGQAPSVLSVAIESPTGERTGRIPARLGSMQTFDLVFENSKITVYYDLAELTAGDEVIVVKIQSPTEGIWRVLIYSNTDDAVFNSYLPGKALIGTNAYFLNSDPNITLTDPSSVDAAVSVSGYDTLSGAFYADSGRGFTRSGRIKPDLCGPCTAITGPNLRGGYELRSGTSLAAALTGGACAQFLTWAITYQNAPFITSMNIRTILIRGAIRKPGISYPSRQWGYGTLNVYNSFEVLRGGGEL